jgi:photosynthetic reaction center cytochrome c subunit
MRLSKSGPGPMGEGPFLKNTSFLIPEQRSRGRCARVSAAIALTAMLVLLAGCDRTESVQNGPRGLALWQLYDMDQVAEKIPENQIPEPEYRDPPMEGLPPLTDVMENIEVLHDLNPLEFSRLMNAISTWVSPEAGCEYCHNTDEMAEDSKYGKHVARRMLLMVRDINTNWKSHVRDTGVTCWTCHRGENVPSGIWFEEPGPKVPGSYLAKKGGQNVAGVADNGNAALPFDPLTPFLKADHEVRVQGTRPLAGANRNSIKQAEWTYSLMMYMSNSLGVNCTYCHNTRAMGVWDESLPQRVTAWHGIRMVRDINEKYLTPLKELLPAHRLSPEGDPPKVGCQTCHKGVYKPLYGVTMLDDYGELRGVVTERPAPWEIPFLEEMEQEESEGGNASEPPQDDAPAGASQAAVASTGHSSGS